MPTEDDRVTVEGVMAVVVSAEIEGVIIALGDEANTRLVLSNGEAMEMSVALAECALNRHIEGFVD
jgi:hypothetical protein